MKYLSIIALLCLLVVSLPARADDADNPAGVAALLCKMSTHGQVMTQTLSIDYDKQLVNGISANFSPSIISWTIENGSKSEHYELNRVTGSYNSWTDSGTSTTPTTTFTCAKAPKKF